MGRHVKGQAWDRVAVVTVAAATTRHLCGKRRVDGVGRLKVDFRTASHPTIALTKPPRRRAVDAAASAGLVDPQSINRVTYTTADGK